MKKLDTPPQPIPVTEIVKFTQDDLQGRLRPALRDNPDAWKTALEELSAAEDKKVEHFRLFKDATALHIQKNLSDKRKAEISKKLKEVEPLLEQRRKANVVGILQSIANSLERIAGSLDPKSKRS